MRNQTHRFWTLFSFVPVHLHRYILSQLMHQQVLSKDLNFFIALSIYHLIPFLRLQQLLNSFRIVMNTANLRYIYKDFYFEARNNDLNKIGD